MNKPAKRTRVTVAVAMFAVVAAAATPGIAAAGATTILASKSSPPANVKGNAASGEPSISNNGRYIAFNSDATNLVADDSNDLADCFVRDETSKSTERVSVASGGGQSNGYCFGPAISKDGRFVAFESNATNLGGSDNSAAQIYVHDRQTGSTTLVSERTGGGQGGNAGSSDPAISGNGRFVVYQSKASNLVADDTNGGWDVFLFDRNSGETTRVSVVSNGAQANRASTDPDISADGTVIVFESKATNLAKNDTNRRQDVFSHNLTTGKTNRVSVTSLERQANGDSANPTVNGNGLFIAFQSTATNLVGADPGYELDVFLRDVKKGKTIQVSLTNRGEQAAGSSLDPTISSSGRYVAFESSAKNLSTKDKDSKLGSYVRDRIQKKTRIVSLKSNGSSAYGDSSDPAISGDGRFVAFESTAAKIVASDSDKKWDVFRRGPLL